MAKAPTRAQKVEALNLQNASDEATINEAYARIESRKQHLTEIQKEIIAELKACGGVVSEQIPVGGITNRHELREGDLIVAQGGTWAGSVLGSIVVFKEVRDDQHVRAWTDHKRTSTDYGRGFLFLARPIEVKK